MEKLTTKQIIDGHLDNWRQLAQALHARFHTGDFVTGLTFVTAVTAVTEAAERANHHPDVTLTYPFVDVKLISHDVSHIDLAADLDAVARRSGSLRKEQS